MNDDRNLITQFNPLIILISVIYIYTTKIFLNSQMLIVTKLFIFFYYFFFSNTVYVAFAGNKCLLKNGPVK